MNRDLKIVLITCALIASLLILAFPLEGRAAQEIGQDTYNIPEVTSIYWGSFAAYQQSQLTIEINDGSIQNIWANQGVLIIEVTQDENTVIIAKIPAGVLSFTLSFTPGEVT